jgi:hypothetical protein
MYDFDTKPVLSLMAGDVVEVWTNCWKTVKEIHIDSQNKKLVVIFEDGMNWAYCFGKVVLVRI